MQPKKIRILIAGDSDENIAALKDLFVELGKDKYGIEIINENNSVLESLSGNRFDISFLGETIGKKNVLDLLAKAAEGGSKTPVIIFSRSWNKKLDEMALKSGAADYIVIDGLKPALLDHTVQFTYSRLHVKETLEAERDFLETLLGNIPDTIYFKDKESRFTRINVAQARVLGVKDPADAIGKTDFDFFEHAKEAYADEQEIIRTGKPLINKQEKIKRADGEYRFVTATKVPIRNKAGEITGTVGITRDITDRVKAEKELEVVKEHLEEAMKNVNEELDMARQIQKSLLPESFPDMKGIRAAAAYVPCSAIGGDLYEVIKIDEKRIGLLMFDVVGHGVPAALVAAMSKMIFTKNIARGLSPKALLDQTNDELEYHFHGKRYLAAFYGILDVESKKFTFSKGGHPPAMVMRADKPDIQYLSTEGIFIGLFPNSQYHEETVDLNKGDRLIMFTDGLIETFNNQEEYFGLKRLEEVLLDVKKYPVDVMISAVLNAQKGFSETSHHVDDVTVLIIEMT